MADFMFSQLLKTYNSSKQNLDEIFNIGRLYHKASDSNNPNWKDQFMKLSEIVANLTEISDKFSDIIATHQLSNVKIEQPLKIECNNNDDSIHSKDCSPDISFSTEFYYPRPLYDEYREGFKGSCVICSTDPKEKDTFYVNDISGDKLEILSKLHKSINKRDQKRLFTLPEPGTVFGLLDEEFITRVVRSSLNVIDGKFQVYFLESGEMKLFSKSSTEMFKLAESDQTMASKALKCRLNKISNELGHKDNFFDNNSYKSLDFEVVAVEKGHLVVNLSKITVQQQNKNISSSIETSSMSSQEDYSDNTKIDANHQLTNGNKSSSDDETIKAEQLKKSTNPFLNNSLDAEDDRSVKSSSEDNNSYKITKDTLTEKQVAALFENPVTTTNAMKAVMGYVPKDDARICRYYNPKTGGCFKGQNCTREHIPINKDGWTKDKDEIKFKVSGKYIYPKIGSKITIEPTHFEDINSFYGLINSKPPGASSERSLLDLNNQINNNQDKLRRASNLSLSQLVIAPYTDGNFYRGKIIDQNDDCYEIFYVDYGNKALVGLGELKVWEDCFDDLPFQAVKFSVADIDVKSPFSVEGIHHLENKILNRPITARVIDVLAEELIVQIYSEENEDIGEYLVTLGFALPRKRTNFVPMNKSMLPG